MHLKVHIVYMGALRAGDYSPHHTISVFFKKLFGAARLMEQDIIQVQILRGNMLVGMVPTQFLQQQVTR
ncbi:hypothetical protein Ddye_023927 [Dipteronia dyeriana]|uniref:Uncharacterized protein n=1 Tax=Dipteronia dyeriana TaxID=168575 RepID=A0AAD9WSI6_9ROSI|nr:hypothetical protein Ddye_023927 [Dipteronia dyeriana]